MDAPRELTLMLPPDLAQVVRDKIADGGYADEMDVIRDGLAAMAEDERGADHGMVEAIRREYDAWMANTHDTVSMEDIRAEIAAERAAGG